MPAVRRALVTGGARGIGRCIAATLARDGCDVCVFDRDTPDDANQFVTEIESETGCRVFQFPKQEEFFVGLKLDA